MAKCTAIFLYLAKNAGFQQDRRKSGSPPGTENTERLKPFVCQRLSGLAHTWFLSKFGYRRCISSASGSIMFILGFIAVAIIGVNKLYDLYAGNPTDLITDSPYFYLALTTMIIGTQLFLCRIHRRTDSPQCS